MARRRKVNFQTGRNRAKSNGRTCHVLSCRGVAPILNKQSPIHARESNYSVNYPVFDRRSDEIDVIGLIPGSGPQSKEGFAVVPAVGVLLRGTDFAWCFDPEIRLPRPAGCDAPLFALSDTVSDGSAKGVENNSLPKLSPLFDPRSAPGFCGVSNARGAGLAFAACVLSSGCVRTAMSASLRLCAACSAFSAAAVVLATCGVTSSGRRTSSRSRARRGVLEGLPLSIFNFAMRDERVETSSVCWRIASLMFRDVRFIVSSDGALERRQRTKGN
jgi:hypothetical protein